MGILFFGDLNGNYPIILSFNMMIRSIMFYDDVISQVKNSSLIFKVL